MDPKLTGDDFEVWFLNATTNSAYSYCEIPLRGSFIDLPAWNSFINPTDIDIMEINTPELVTKPSGVDGAQVSDGEVAEHVYRLSFSKAKKEKCVWFVAGRRSKCLSTTSFVFAVFAVRVIVWFCVRIIWRRWCSDRSQNVHQEFWNYHRIDAHIRELLCVS